MKEVKFSYTGSSIKMAQHALLLCVMFPFSIWAMMHFFGNSEELKNHIHYIYMGVAAGCLIIFMIGVLPNILKKRIVRIAIDEDYLQVFFTDSVDYKINIKDISKIHVITESQRSTMKSYFIVKNNGERLALPHYYNVPIHKVVKYLKETNPSIEWSGNVRY